MSDLHGAAGAGWVGFDLDGTLAEYHGWRGEQNIGAPVAPVVSLIRLLRERGVEVKIVTARVSPRGQPVFSYPNPYMAESLTIENPDKMPWAFQTTWGAREFIQEWCHRNLGFVPEITHEKDYRMLCLIDDRCVQVEPNTGMILGRLPPELSQDGVAVSEDEPRRRCPRSAGRPLREGLAMPAICGDNRFEVISRARKAMIEGTNISSSPEEMKVLDNILFRAWQLGWLKKYELPSDKTELAGG